MELTLKSRQQFQAVFDRGRYLTRRGSPITVIGVLQPELRIGIMVRRSVAKAVQRNLLKRRIKAIFQEASHSLGWRGHYVVSVSKDVLGMKYVQMRECLQTSVQAFLVKSGANLAHTEGV